MRRSTPATVRYEWQDWNDEWVAEQDKVAIRIWRGDLKISGDEITVTIDG